MQEKINKFLRKVEQNRKNSIIAPKKEKSKIKAKQERNKSKTKAKQEQNKRKSRKVERNGTNLIIAPKKRAKQKRNKRKSRKVERNKKKFNIVVYFIEKIY